MRVCFTIPYPPGKEKSEWTKRYGLNAYWSGKHWSRRKDDANYWHTLVKSELLRQGIKPAIATKPVILHFGHNDRLDCSNHAAMEKMIEDALIGYLIEDDDRKHVIGKVSYFHNGGAIFVTVEEVQT